MNKDQVREGMIVFYQGPGNLAFHGVVMPQAWPRQDDRVRVLPFGYDLQVWETAVPLARTAPVATDVADGMLTSLVAWAQEITQEGTQPELSAQLQRAVVVARAWVADVLGAADAAGWSPEAIELEAEGARLAADRQPYAWVRPYLAAGGTFPGTR